MGQSFNLQGILQSFRVLTSPRLMVPNIVVRGKPFNRASRAFFMWGDNERLAHLVPTSSSWRHTIDIRDINFEQLHKAGIIAIAFDKDNCLTKPYGLELHPPFKVHPQNTTLWNRLLLNHLYNTNSHH